MNLYTLKQNVEDWLRRKGIENCSVIGLGKGCRGVEIWMRKGNAESFIAEHGNTLETALYKGYFTSSHNGYAVYVSMVLNK